MIAGCGHNMLGIHNNLLVGRQQISTFFNHFTERDFPLTSRPFISIGLPFPFDHYAALACALGHRHGHISGVNITIRGVINGALQIITMHKGIAGFDLLGRQPFIRHTATFCSGRIDHIFIHTLFGLRHTQVPHDRKPRIQASFRFQRFIKFYRILVNMGGRIRHVKQWQKPGCVPSRARCQLIAL